MSPVTTARGRPTARTAPLALIVILLLLGVAPAAAMPSGADPPSTDGGYDWPIVGEDGPPSVLHDFDPPEQPWLPGHRGVDLAGDAGAEVLAAGSGTVAFAGDVAGRPVVSIVHPDGLRTTYEPVIATVGTGDAVEIGDVIGHLATAGSHCSSPCLHWGVRTSADVYLDPLVLVSGAAIIRLYPPAQG